MSSIIESAAREKRTGIIGIDVPFYRQLTLYKVIVTGVPINGEKILDDEYYAYAAREKEPLGISHPLIIIINLRMQTYIAFWREGREKFLIFMPCLRIF